MTKWYMYIPTNCYVTAPHIDLSYTTYSIHCIENYLLIFDLFELINKSFINTKWLTNYIGHNCMQR